MRLPYGQMVGMQAAAATQWLGMVVSMLNWYSGILDPRPDLARHARNDHAAYAWWW